MGSDGSLTSEQMVPACLVVDCVQKATDHITMELTFQDAEPMELMVHIPVCDEHHPRLKDE